MTSAGPVPLRKYASGGIANSPQMAMYGEGSLPEAYVPLPDGRRIPVAMNMPQSQSWGGGNSGGALAIEVTSRIDKDGNIKAYVEKVSGTVAGQVVQYSSPGIVQQSVGAVAAMNRNSPGYVRKV